MPAVTPDQGIALPVGTDLASVVAALANTVASIETRLNLRYANAADRLARHPAGIEGECSDLAAENWADSFDGAAWISRTARGYRGMKVRTTDAAAINNSVALVNDATMVVPLLAAGTFIFGGELFYDSSTIADVKLAFTWPGAPTASRWGLMGRNSGTTTNIDAPVTSVSGTAQALGSLGVGTTTWGKFFGIIVNTGAAGNLQAQYAQNTADPTDLRIRAGSRLWVLQVA